MNCKKCGTPLNGNELNCPVCGDNIQQQNIINNQVIQDPMNNGIDNDESQQDTMPKTIDPSEVASVTGNTNISTETSIDNSNTNSVPTSQNIVQIQGTTETSQVSKKNTKKEGEAKQNIERIVLIVIISVLIVFGIVIIFIFGTDKNETENSETKEIQEETESNEQNVEYVDFHGYSFEIPKEYDKEITDDYLLLYNFEIAYIIMIDYSNNYENYKTNLMAINPPQAATMEITNSNRIYSYVSYTTADGGFGRYYATKAKDDSAFIGAVLKIGGNEPSQSALNDLTIILNKALLDEDIIVKGTEEDAGKEGLNIITPAASTIPFK